MAKKKVAGKVNRVVYIDSDLDGRMKKASDVNWSAVASAAFERELVLQSRKTVMQSTIERMRAENEEDKSELFDDGSEWGAAWAKDIARPKELRRLSRWRSSMGADFDRVNIDALQVAQVVEARTDMSGRDVTEWFENTGDDPQHDDEEWLRGFVDGAIGVWAEVEPQL